MSTGSDHSEKQVQKRGDSRPAVALRRRRRTAGRILLLICLVAVVCWAAGAFTWGIKWQARRELSARRPGRALEWLSIAQRLGRNDAEVEYLIARAHRKRGEDFERFRAHLKRAKQFGLSRQKVQFEQTLAFAQTGYMRIAEPRLPRLLIDHSSEGAEIFEAYVKGYILLSQSSHAMLLLDYWIEEFPDDPQAYFLRGTIYKQDNEQRSAAADFRRAYELDDSFHAAAYELAMVLADRGEIEQALEYFTLVGNDEEYGTKAKVGLARCRRLLGDIDSARDVLSNLPARGDARAEISFERGQIELHRGNYRKAVEHFQLAHSLKPRDGQIRIVLGNALRLAGDPDAAEKHVQWFAESEAASERKKALLEKLSRKPDDVALRCELGKIEMKFGVPEVGVLWLTSALNSDPDCREAHKVLARYYDSRADENRKFAKLAAQHRTAAADPE